MRETTLENARHSSAHMCTAPAGSERATSDNIGLSEAHPSSAPSRPIDDLVSQYLDASRAENTRRAYEWDLKDFEEWGGHVPTTADEVARYLAQRASSLRPSTLHRRLAALASIHRDRGLTDPTKAPLVRRVLQGIERKHGTAVDQVAPLLIDDLVRVIAAMGTTNRDLRDKAILLVGFFGALRRSEIVALDVSSLVRTGDALVVRVERSKTDQVGHGRAVHVHARNDALCPVQAIVDWLATSRSCGEPLFGPIDAGRRMSARRLSGRTVASIVKKRAAAAGLPSKRFSGHSLRAGFATSAAIAGFDATMIARQTGHRTQQALGAYVRPAPASVCLIPAQSH